MNAEYSPPRVRSKHAPKRTAAQRAADLVLSEERHLKGWTHARIAEHLSSVRGYVVSRQQVAYDLKKLEREWKREAQEVQNLGRTRMLKALDLIESVAWDAWEKSTLPIDGSAHDGRPGDPVYLRRVLESYDRRIRLLGLDQTSNQPTAATNASPPLSDETHHAILERHFKRMRYRLAPSPFDSPSADAAEVPKP